MKPTLKKQAAAMFVSGLGVDAIARALEITPEEAIALLPKSAARAAAKPVRPPAPVHVPLTQSARDARLAKEAADLARYRAKIALHPTPTNEGSRRVYGSGAGVCATVTPRSRTT